MGEIFSLKNQIQNYAWGSREILGRMRGVPVPTEQPEAEVWVGAHPAAPSRATVDGAESPLNELIVENPSRFLRPDRTSDWFPFLFKILAIDAPLSIQVHPTPEQAIAGFEDEQARGIAIDAPYRNYKDRYSKPETVIALSPMRVLTGVRPVEQLKTLAAAFGAAWLAERAELSPKQLLTEIIRLPEETASAAVQHLVDTAPGLLGASNDVVADAAELVRIVDGKYPGDRGLLVAFVMNLVHLAPGESAFTPDGQVHAYVSGTAIELMNPSDNVMRAGLTAKHIDTEELIKVLGEKQDAPVIQRPNPEDGPLGTYAMWDERMSVTRVRVEEGKPLSYTFKGISAALSVAGKVTIQAKDGNGTDEFVLGATESVLHVGEPSEAVLSGSGELYIASYV
ncbi:MAG: mannose-6-phosphate isomerase, class I [Rothia mucilaginosa]|uniref:mannose-6-phosphate isomerase, class I n=1 Tax=Rothia TaxID=32207 RepID=UPI00066D241B|nr:MULTISPECIES: mannose-6-phosphate isomerase, class I [Rothia]MBS4945769.1 mannose-6-phosphate isomerase, class I [Rothia mucilaginosa]MDU6366675.1 mannose-6-phosphate isomerase, class I [Rothia mucilaginosa]OHP77206.1 mannose-6-phosphate isomerase [Rothia sp. HMSC062F03]